MSQRSIKKFIIPQKSAARLIEQRALRQAKQKFARARVSTVRRNTLPFGARDPGFVDLANANRGCDTTGSITLVATIAQGTTINQRIGKKAQYKSFQVRGHIFAGSLGTISQAGWMLVYDKRPSGALPAITDILTSVSSFAFPNDANANRFHTIKRCDYEVIGDSTGPATDSVAYKVEEYVKFKGMIGFKAAGTGAIADIEEGAVYLVTYGDTAAGTGAPDSDLAIRTRFVDV